MNTNWQNIAIAFLLGLILGATIVGGLWYGQATFQ